MEVMDTNRQAHVADVNHIWTVYPEFKLCVYVDVNQMYLCCLWGLPSFIWAELTERQRRNKQRREK